MSASLISLLDAHRNESESAAVTPEDTPSKPKVTPLRSFLTPRKDTPGKSTYVVPICDTSHTMSRIETESYSSCDYR